MKVYTARTFEFFYPNWHKNEKTVERDFTVFPGTLRTLFCSWPRCDFEIYGSHGGHVHVEDPVRCRGSCQVSVLSSQAESLQL